jgi:hypothetical protein
MMDYLKTARPSVWLCIVSWAMSAAMMHPSFATLWVLFIEALLLGSIRWFASKGL